MSCNNGSNIGKVSVMNQIHYLSSAHFNTFFIAPKCDSERTFYF